MNSNPLSLELLPLEASEVNTTSEPVAADAGGVPPVVPASSGQAAKIVDKWLAAATAEYENGNIEQPLWERALAQASGDHDQAVAHYLRSRAIALRVLKRETPRPRQAPPIDGSSDSAAAAAAPRADGEKAGRRGAKLKTYRMIAVGAACAGIVLCFALAYFYSGTEPAVAMAATAPKPNRAVEAAAEASIQAKAVAAQDAAVGPVQELKAKIDQLKDAGNWHVLVLYAAELTRLEPGNAVAWNQLSLGYQRLHQYGEAHDAALKAVAIAPDDASYWRDAAQLELQLNQPEKALRAFETAISRDGKDTQSLVQSGVLYFQLARIDEAKGALEKAVAANPDDPNVLCLKSLISRGDAAGKEATAVASQSRFIDGNCSDAKDRMDRVELASTQAKSVTVFKKRY